MILANGRNNEGKETLIHGEITFTTQFMADSFHFVEILEDLPILFIPFLESEHDFSFAKGGGTAFCPCYFLEGVIVFMLERHCCLPQFLKLLIGPTN